MISINALQIIHEYHYYFGFVRVRISESLDWVGSE